MSQALRVRRSLLCMFLALGVAASGAVFAHGGVSMEDDSCVMQIGPYDAHFTGYQPALRASQEFCEDIPVAAAAGIVLDFIDAPLRELDVDFRVVRDVNAIGVDATYDDLGDAAAVEAATVFYASPQRYPRGNLNVALEFNAPGHFIGVVTARDAAGERYYVSVFPFAVGITRWYSGWGWLLAALLLGGALYLVPGRGARPSERMTAKL